MLPTSCRQKDRARHPALGRCVILHHSFQSDRYAFLKTILTELEKQNYANKLDNGWNSHDVEIDANLWAWLHLTTVSEELGNGELFLRCRLQTGWSLLAKTGFAIFTIALLFLVIWLAPIQHWIWMSWTTLPLLVWCLENEQIALRCRMNATIHAAANVLKLEPYNARKSASFRSLVLGGTKKQTCASEEV